MAYKESLQEQEPAERPRAGLPGTFMSQILDKLKNNPGMAAAGAGMLGNMSGGDMVKFAVAAYAAYKLYNRYMDRQNGVVHEKSGTGKVLTAAGKSLVDGVKTGATKLRDMAYDKIDEDTLKVIGKRFDDISGYTLQKDSEVLPGGYTRSQLNGHIDKVSPVSATDTFRDAVVDGKRSVEYMSHLADEAEHAVEWDKCLSSQGISDLSGLKFYATGDDGLPLERDGKRMMVDPYASLGRLPDNASAEDVIRYAAKKCEIDDVVRYAMDHGDVCAELDGRAVSRPMDDYVANLDAMDANKARFTCLTADIRMEQAANYSNASEERKMAAIPRSLGLSREDAMAFLGASEIINDVQAESAKNEALTFAQGADPRRVAVGQFLMNAKPVEAQRMLAAPKQAEQQDGVYIVAQAVDAARRVDPSDYGPSVQNEAAL